MRLKKETVRKPLPFNIKPRKGQFIILKPTVRHIVPTHIIEPVATQFTKGVIIWTTLYGNVIGMWLL